MQVEQSEQYWPPMAIHSSTRINVKVMRIASRIIAYPQEASMVQEPTLGGNCITETNVQNDIPRSQINTVNFARESSIGPPLG